MPKEPTVTGYTNQVMTSPIEVAKIAIIVTHPSIFIARLFTRLPMMTRLLVMSMINNIRGGVENPCTIPDQTSTFMGFSPMKFMLTARRVNAIMEA